MERAPAPSGPRGRYESASARKISGATYTPPELAAFVAREIMARAAHFPPEKPIRIFDPAVGDGALLLALAAELSARGYRRIVAGGFDVDPVAASIARNRIQAADPSVLTHIQVGDFLAGPAIDRQDLVIANPPYVRTQILGAARASSLAKEYALKGRVDLSHAFLFALEKIMAPDSVAGVIVSNRFLSTRSGASVRRGLWEKFELHAIWDLGDTKIFDAAVLPAVLLLGAKRELESVENRSRPVFSSIYASRAETGTFETREGRLQFDDPAEVWRIDDGESEEWLETVHRHAPHSFRDIGRVHVGIKTTADRVFIRSDWGALPGGRPELLRPVITHRCARRFRALDSRRVRDAAEARFEVLYPHALRDGVRCALNLEKFPLSKRYLESHRAVLEGRRYLKDAGRAWYEIWVPQDPAAWERPKLVFRDICERPTFWMDPGGAVVNGDCYWMCAENPERENWLWLALAVANSSFIERYYDRRFNNRLYAGRRRFMSQYVERFPLPDPRAKLSQRIVECAREIHLALARERAPGVERTETELDPLVWQAFGLTMDSACQGHA